MNSSKLQVAGTVPGVLGMLGLYGFVHGSMRLTGSWNLGENDPFSVVRTQSLERLTDSGAALFDVLTYLMIDLMGPSALVFQILRYGLLTIALLLVFLTARRVLNSGFWALLTVESYVLIYQITWRLHEGFTHPLIAMIMVAGLVWSFSLLLERWSLFAFLAAVWFAAAGGLTGIWFWSFCVSLLLAVCFIKPFNNRFWIVMITFVGLLIASLHLWQTGFISQRPIDSVSFKAAFDTGLKVVSYLSPLLPIVLILFRANLFSRADDDPPLISLIRVSFWIASALLIIAAFVSGGTNYAVHAIAPLFFVTPIWWMDRIRRTNPSERKVTFFCALIACAILACLVLRAGNLFILDPACKRCYFGLPYQGLVTHLKADKTFSKAEHVISPNYRLSGNIYSYWPEGPAVLNPDEAASDKTLFVWNPQMSEERRLWWMEAMGLSEEEQTYLTQHHTAYEIPWPHLWRPTGYRSTTWYVAMLPPKS